MGAILWQVKEQYHRELGMLIKEAQFERSELIVEIAKVYNVFTVMKVKFYVLIRTRIKNSSLDEHCLCLYGCLNGFEE